LKIGSSKFYVNKHRPPLGFSGILTELQITLKRASDDNLALRSFYKTQYKLMHGFPYDWVYGNG
jgi:hypothetical protein